MLDPFLILAATNPKLAIRLTGGRFYDLVPPATMLIWTQDLDKSKAAKVAIHAAIIALPEKLGNVIRARFGEGITLQAYGRRIERSRERVRQMEARALRCMRWVLVDDLTLIHEAVEVVPVPGGACDPDWITTLEAGELTGLTRDHLRHLTREGKVESHRDPRRRNRLLINRSSMKAYMTQGPSRRGIWKGD